MDRKDHFLDSEMYLMTGKTACFSFDGRDYQDRSGFIEDFDEKLSTLEHDTLSRYGEELFECLFPPGTETRRGFYEASAIAAERRLTLRFRLRLGAGLPASIHRFSWECLRDRIQPLDLARATRIAFSRYFARGLTRPCPAVANPRVLGVISAPCDLSRYNMAKVDSKDLKQVLHGAFDTLDTAIQSEILDSPATRSRIRRHLQRAQCQVLHFLGHGSVDRQEISRLVLEDDQHKADFLTERELAELLSGLSDLRLVILTACHSGSSPQGGFSGLAGRLVEVGVPAVVAFRRSVPFSTAKLFTQYFYSELMRVGHVDAAVNATRHLLFLDFPRRAAWSDPVLFMRLGDGRVWLHPSSSHEERHPSSELLDGLCRLRALGQLQTEEHGDLASRLEVGTNWESVAVEALLPTHVDDLQIAERRLSTPKVARRHQIWFALRQGWSLEIELFGILFVLVPPGTLRESVRNSTAFYLASGPVSQAAWCKVMGGQEGGAESAKVDVSPKEIVEFLRTAGERPPEPNGNYPPEDN